jgi:hypothetical protein
VLNEAGHCRIAHHSRTIALRLGAQVVFLLGSPVQHHVE